MKKINLLICLGFFSANLLGQNEWNSINNSTSAMYRKGFVGIGTGAAPSIPFAVRDSSGAGVKVAFGTNGLTGSYGSGDAILEITSPTTSDGTIVQLSSGSGSTRYGLFLMASPYGVTIGSNRGSGGTAQPLTFATHGAAGLTTKMEIGLDGKIKIGSVASTPGTYKLYVKDGILTEKVKVAVDNTANWSDYVFSKDYKLMSLKEVDVFVKKNKHLPGVPSAEEIVKDGIDVATMDAKLLEKIEELTLYVIELKKDIEKLKQENTSSKAGR